MVFNIKGKTKKEIFSQPVVHFHKNEPFNKPKEIIDSLLEREAIKSSVIGQGIVAQIMAKKFILRLVYLAVG